MATRQSTIEKYRNSHNAVLIDTLGWVYLRLGNINEATYLLEKASTLDPDNKQILYHYAEALSQKGLNQKAKMTLEQALTDAGSFRGLAEAKTLADRLR
jgi:cytochrome c-type biogenesis protein CcmH/NrfG